MKNVLAIALAGGRGERMGPLCNTMAKPALPIGGDTRVIDYCLSNCINSGIKNIAIATGYQGDSLAQYVTSWAAANNGHSRIHILQPEKAAYSGTADAVWQNIDFVKRNGFEWIIVLPTDHVSKMNLERLLQFHIAKGADVTVASSRVPEEHAHRYGIITPGATGRILDFREKPRMPSGNIASMGVYVFNRQALLESLAADAAEPGSPHDFGYSVIPSIIEKKRVFSYPFSGYWRDIGTVDAYYETNMELIDRLPSLNADKKWHVPTHAVSLLTYNSCNQGSITHSLVGPRCIIKGKVENSVLSPGVVIGENAVVKNSIVMSGATIGEFCHLDNCIISENAKIGAFCKVGLGSGETLHTFDTRVIIGSDTSVPAYTLVPDRSRPAWQQSAQASAAEMVKHAYSTLN